MKNNIRKIVGYLLIIPITFVLSCKKLDVPPISSVTSSNFGQSATQIEAAYTASMNFLWGRYYGYADVIFYVFQNDDQWQGGNLVIPANNGDLLWQMHYQALTNINNALLAIKQGRVQGETPQTIAALTGEGKLLRAHNYFNLVRLFGDVPLITEDTPDPANNLMARSSVKDVYTLIVSDLQYAADNLPDSWSNAPGKPTSGTAKSLLAKAYLTMATYPLNDPNYYQKAADAANSVINSGTYALTDSCVNVFKPENKYSREMIWSYNSTYDDRTSSARSWAPSEWLTGGWDGAPVDTAFEHHWTAQPRKDAYLLLGLNGQPYTTAFVTATPYVKKFFYYITESDFNKNQCATNLPIIRYADVLLIYAEAANQANGGPTQAACDAINLVINRANGYVPNAGHPLLTTRMSKQNFDNAVIQERNWELCFEQPDRWFDICRKRILDKVSAPYPQELANYSPNDYLFPIPQADLKTDKLLTQNPGYPTP